MSKRTSPNALSQVDGVGKSARISDVSESREFSTGLLVYDGSTSPPVKRTGIPGFDLDFDAHIATWRKWRHIITDKLKVREVGIDEAYLQSI
jgi:hypothetical protein